MDQKTENENEILNQENKKEIEKKKEEKYILPEEFSQQVSVPLIQVSKSILPNFNKEAEKIFPELSTCWNIPAGKRMKFLTDELKKNDNKIIRGNITYHCAILNIEDKTLYLFGPTLSEKQENFQVNVTDDYLQLEKMMEQCQSLFGKIENGLEDWTVVELEKEKEKFNRTQAQMKKKSRDLVFLNQKNLLSHRKELLASAFLLEITEIIIPRLESIDIFLSINATSPAKIKGNPSYLQRAIYSFLVILSSLLKEKKEISLAVGKSGDKGSFIFTVQEEIELPSQNTSLAVIQKILRLMDGELFQSQTNSKSEFHFILPIARRAVKVASPALKRKPEEIILDDTGGFGEFLLEFSSILPEKYYSEEELDF